MNLLGNPPEITDKLIQKIINGHFDVKVRQFTEEELEEVFKKNWIEKLDEIPLKV